MQAPTALSTYESKILDHLRLVAGTSDELEIGERIDSCIAQDLDQREVSIRQAAGAMVINGLGIAYRSLYLTPRFFKNRPTERLIGEGENSLLVVSVRKWALSVVKTVIKKASPQCSRETAFLERRGGGSSLSKGVPN